MDAHYPLHLNIMGSKIDTNCTEHVEFNAHIAHKAGMFKYDYTVAVQSHLN